MEKLTIEKPQSTTDSGLTVEEALNSLEEREVLWAVRTLLGEVVNNVLPVIAEKFTPEECADIVFWASKDYGSQEGKRWVTRAVQAHLERKLKAEHDFGTWSAPQGDQS